MVNRSILVTFLCICYASANPVDYFNEPEYGEIDPNELYEIIKPFHMLVPTDNYFIPNNGETDLSRDVHPDWGKNVVQLIKRHGYPVETHTVTTIDGYKLGIHRIPSGKNSNNYYYEDASKPVALVMPGILCSSADWVVNGPGKAIAYILADAGYDVWLGNPRGTTSSRKHTTLKPNKDAEFWNFSYHEMGTRDLPAIIDYILDKTEQPNLHYIAHSQGATSFFVLASELPEYNGKIRLMSALAPVTYSGNVKNPFIRLILPILDELVEFVQSLEINEVLQHTRLITYAARMLCNDDASTQDLCSLILFLATGFDAPQLNKTMLPVIYSNFPAGASVKQIFHFAQNMKSGRFQQYDYGPEQNLEHYGDETAPEYDLSKVTAPVAAFYSTNDWIASDVDVRQLLSVLPNVVLDHPVDYKKFNHLDYMWATDAGPLLYDIILSEMKNY